jgi:cytochrome c2
MVSTLKAVAVAAAASVFLAAVAAAAVTVGHAERGAELFKSQKCVTCHSIKGEGGKLAPDLGRLGGKGWTPDAMAALMWNHAPQMWEAMDKAGVAPPKISRTDAADLFAYFYAARAFEKPGDAGRGRALFANKGCAECHSLAAGSKGNAPSVLSWESVGDPIELARQMWNHAPKMRAAMEAKKMKVPTITGAEMNDMVVYLSSLPQMRGRPAQFSPASAETGEMLLEAKGCKGCHTGANSFERKQVFETAADFTAAMWNHSGQMKQDIQLRSEEMKRIAGYVWSQQVSSAQGSPGRGAKVFDSKGCAGCHSGGKQPKVANAFEVVSGLWSHGPTMLKQVQSQGKSWPRLDTAQMTDLVAHLAQAR